jgi:hypothetical protein
MTDMEIVPLDQEGITYVEICLQQGSGLCEKARNLELANGQVFAPLPKNTNLKRALSFSTGGLMSRHNVNAWLEKHVRSLWHCWPSGTLVIQDIWAKSSDLVVRNSNLKTFFQQDGNVYFFCEKDNAESVQRTVSATASYLFIAFFSRYSMSSVVRPFDRVVGEDVINEIARNTQEIFVGAYDHEGLVVWRSP